MRPFFLFMLITLIAFSGCKVGGLTSKNKKTPETHREKLLFYRTQIISLESEIDFHLKHQNDYALKSDYIRLEECLNGLSEILEQEDQATIKEIIGVMHKTLEDFKKSGSYSFFSRGNDKMFTQLRKLRKKIMLAEKQKEQTEQTEEKTKSDNSKKEADTKK